MLLFSRPSGTLLSRFTASTERGDPACPTRPAAHGGRRGAPAIFGRSHFDALMQTEGDRGGRGLIETHAGDVLEVETGDPHMLADIDTPEDLTRLQALKDEW